ncbi:MAG: AMP-binding protein [Alphaproteobacteria bacterium]
MADQSFFSLIANRSGSWRQRCLLETETGQSYLYGDLEERTARLAGYLTALGLKTGDRVAAQIDKSPEALFLYLACLRAGLVYVPINPACREGEVEHVIADCAPSVVVAAGRLQAMVGPVCQRHGVQQVLTLDADGGGSLMDGAASRAADFATIPCAGDDLACLVYSSGTTGRPKGAMVTHRNLAANGLALVEHWGFGDGDVLLHALPLFHVHGLFVACHCVLLSGARMLWLDRFDRAKVIDALGRVTVMMGVPTYYTRLLAGDDFTAGHCSGLRLAISGSAPLAPETFDEFRARTGHAILERYGMTETGMNTSNPVVGVRISGTVGPALAGVSLRVTGEGGEVLGPNRVGMLEVKGDNVFKGYWRQPGLTAQAFTADGYFRTGDLAEIDAAGVVTITGRAVDMIITGGLNVYPKEIEDAIGAMDGIKECAAVGVPHTDFGEAIIVAAVTDGGECGEDEVIEMCKDRLANYKVPKRVLFVDELPRNVMGKIQKAELRRRFATVLAQPSAKQTSA